MTDLYRNPDVKEITLYTVKVLYLNGSGNTFRNVVSIRQGDNELVLEILSHGIEHRTLSNVHSYDPITQQTLVWDDGDE